MSHLPFCRHASSVTVVASGAADTVFPRPRARTQFRRPLKLAVAINCSSYTNSLPGLKKAFPFGRWYTFGLSSNRTCDLDLWPFDLDTGANYSSWHGNLPTNFAVYGTFSSRFMSQQSCQTGHMTSSTFDFRGHDTTRNAALHAPTLYQVWSPYKLSRSEDMTYIQSQH